MIAWKLGWTKAPKDESLCTVLLTTYEVGESEEDILDVMGIEKTNGHEDEEGTIEVVNMNGIDTILEDPLEKGQNYYEYDTNTWENSSDVVSPKRKDTDSTADMSISEIMTENENTRCSNGECHTFGERDMRSGMSDRIYVNNNERSRQIQSQSYRSTTNEVSLNTIDDLIETQANMSSLPPVFRIRREVSSSTVEDHEAESQCKE